MLISQLHSLRGTAFRQVKRSSFQALETYPCKVERSGRFHLLCLWDSFNSHFPFFFGGFLRLAKVPSCIFCFKFNSELHTKKMEKKEFSRTITWRLVRVHSSSARLEQKGAASACLQTVVECARLSGHDDGVKQGLPLPTCPRSPPTGRYSPGHAHFSSARTPSHPDRLLWRLPLVRSHHQVFAGRPRRGLVHQLWRRHFLAPRGIPREGTLSPLQGSCAAFWLCSMLGKADSSGQNLWTGMTVLSLCTWRTNRDQVHLV